MSREIDFDNLTAEDEVYLAARPWLRPATAPPKAMFRDDAPQPEVEDGEISPDGQPSEVVDLESLGIDPTAPVPENDESEEDNDDGEDEIVADEDDESPYDDMNVDELKALLKERGLSRAGKRDELVERLEADDEVS